MSAIKISSSVYVGVYVQINYETTKEKKKKENFEKAKWKLSREHHMIHILGKSKLSSQRIFCRHGGVAKVSLDKLLHHLVGLENRKCASKKQNKNKKKGVRSSA